MEFRCSDAVFVYSQRREAGTGKRVISDLCAFELQSRKKMDAKLCVVLSAYEHHTRICEYVVHLEEDLEEKTKHKRLYFLPCLTV